MNRRSLFAAAALAASLAVLAAPASAAEDFAVASPYAGTWYGRFGGTNCSWVDLGDGVFVVDTGANAADAQNLKAEIARTTKGKPIKWIALTHLHSDSNDGFSSFLPTDAIVLVNAKAAPLLATSLQGKAKVPTIQGITDRIVLVSGKQLLEVGVPEGNAHTAYDLYVFDPAAKTAWVGDLVTPGRCPMLSDPDSDLKGWLGFLTRLDALKPAAIVPTRGNPATAATAEIDATRRYLVSMLQFLTTKKKQGAPEARVTGELAGEKLGDYCPKELAALNALSVYRRIAADGSTLSGAALKPKAK